MIYPHDSIQTQYLFFLYVCISNKEKRVVLIGAGEESFVFFSCYLFNSSPYRREPKTKAAKSKTSPSYSVNMEDFFFLYSLGRKPKKRQKKTKHLT